MNPRLEKLVRRILARTVPNPATGCLEWTGCRDCHGYGRINVCDYPQLVHRLAWALLVEPIPVGKHVLHRCDNPPCVNIEHLFLGTALDNALDKVAKGRTNSPRGEDNNLSKLTQANVRLIRERFVPWSRTDGVASLAREFGFSETGMRAVLQRKSWGWL